MMDLEPTLLIKSKFNPFDRNLPRNKCYFVSFFKNIYILLLFEILSLNVSFLKKNIKKNVFLRKIINIRIS